MATCQSETVNRVPQATCSELANPDAYQQIRDDLDTLAGDIQSASLLVTFIVMRETENEDASKLSPDFVGALWSVQSLLDGFRSKGDAMVHRMMALEDSGTEGGKAVQS
jgi:hypothetical protein